MEGGDGFVEGSLLVAFWKMDVIKRSRFSGFFWGAIGMNL
jgi:hypothetical protein